MQALANTGQTDNDVQAAVEFLSQCSRELTASYQMLERQVQQLNAELEAVRLARQSEQEQHRRVLNRLDGLMHLLPAGVVLVDAKGVVLEANAFAESCFGPSLVDARWSEVLRSQLIQSRVGNGMALQNGRHIALQSGSTGKDGETLHLLVDLTEEVSLRSELLKQRKLSAMGEMTARLAHQIRTPLTAVQLSLDSLDSTLDEDRRLRGMQRIRGRINELENLVNNLLSYAQQGDLAAEPVSVRGLAHDFSLRCRQDHAADIRVDLQISGDYPLRGNRDLLLSVLDNLAHNAKVACADQLKLVLTLGEDASGGIVLELSDNGPGIQPELHETIFQPFYSSRCGGNGLGLAIARDVIEAHGGSICCLPQQAGACFRISLPAPQRWMDSGSEVCR